MTRRPAIVIENLSALQGGGQTYLVNLLRHVPADLPDRFRIVAIVPDSVAQQLAGIRGVETLTPRAAQKSLLHRFAWQALRLPGIVSDLDAAVVYCPGGTLSLRPGGNVRTAVAFRNMLPFAHDAAWRYPPGYQRVRNALLRRIQGRSFREADAVIFVSEYAKSVIDALVPDRKGESVVIPHGIPERFREVAPRPARIAGTDDYCLYVSSFDIYKAHLEVVEAWRRVCERRDTPEKLLLVGPGNTPYRRRVERLIAKLGMQERVIVPGEVPYEDLPGLYQNARLNIFASACENCPNILLEALASGRPVLCSKYPPMPEFGGDGVVYFDPYRPEELAGHLFDLIDDEAAQHRMGQAAHRQSLKFDWHESARRTWGLLASLADRQ